MCHGVVFLNSSSKELCDACLRKKLMLVLTELCGRPDEGSWEEWFCNWQIMRFLNHDCFKTILKAWWEET